MSDKGFMGKVELSAVWTVIGICVLFSSAIVITLIAPSYVDKTWVEPTCEYQVQMYEVSDPNFYISSTQGLKTELQAVYHIKQDYTLLAFKESDTLRFVAPSNLEKYITRKDDSTLKLTSYLLLLRPPVGSAVDQAKSLRKILQQEWEKEHPNWRNEALPKPDYQVLELFQPEETEAFASAPSEGILENWVDSDFTILDEKPRHPYHRDSGVIYVFNPQEYRVRFSSYAGQPEWRYDPNGQPIKNLEELTAEPLAFKSRKQLIADGEHIYAIEGCWYCHTDQTRTLVQDLVLNGSDSYPAPPSSANEYIYQKITFPGTRRIGPDMSRVGIKRPSRDWHMSHFWSPKTESKGSIMPRFQHFFDNDPRGTSATGIGVPNQKFEAIYQYLMTKGTRITPPTQAWWLGKDPIQTKEIIEGKKKL